MPAKQRAVSIEPEAAPDVLDHASRWGVGFDRSPLPMWVEDETARCFIAVNDAALVKYGYSRGQFLSLTPGDLAGDPAREDGGSHRKADGTLFAVTLAWNRIDVDGRRARLAVVTERDDDVIRKSELRFRQLFEAACDGFWESDVKGRMIDLSPAYEATFGSVHTDMLGKRFQDFPGVTMSQEMVDKALTAIAQHAPYRDFIYSRRHTETQKLRWVHTNCVPVFDQAGVFTGYRGVARDISAQIEAEQALRGSEQRFRQMFELASDFYWELDTRFTYRDVSSRWDTLHGIAFAEMRGKRLVDMPGVYITPEMGKMVLIAQKTKQPFRDFVYSRKLDSGETAWLSICGMPMFDEAGEFNGYQGVGTDITARIQAEVAAGLTQRRLHDAVNYASQPLAVYDGNDTVVAFNAAFVNLHRDADGKYAVFQGVSFAEVSAWEVQTGFYQTLPGQAPVDLEMLHVRHLTEDEHAYHLSDGRWMLVTYHELPGKGRVGVWTDISAVKLAEEEKRRLEEQLHHSQRLEGLGTLAGGAAHEINNSLVPVIALTKVVLGRAAEDSKDRRSLSLVLRGAERARELVSQILAFSRKAEHRQESIDVAAVVGEALRLLSATVPSSIRLEQEIAPVPAVLGDANQLHQVIVNLVANAAQAIGETPGVITIRLEDLPAEHALRLSVADTGCGMSEATKTRIFEPFFTTKEVGKGTGLGLAVVHGIIKDHGGTIAVESTEGVGTRFDIVLPVMPG
jgi:PAS domain S-box-containing protein